MSLMRLCKRKQPIDSLTLSDEGAGSVISDTSELFCTANSDDLNVNPNLAESIGPYFPERGIAILVSHRVQTEGCEDTKLQDEMNDSLNAVTDRINHLELGFSDQSDQLREELILFKQSVKYILTELMRSLRVILSRPGDGPAIRARRGSRVSLQSRTGMRSRQVQPRE